MLDNKGIELSSRTKKRKYLRILLWSIGAAVLLQIIFTGVVMAHNCEPGNEADCMRTAGYLVAVAAGGSAIAGLTAATVPSIIGGSVAGAAGATVTPDTDTHMDQEPSDEPKPPQETPPSEEVKPPDEAETPDEPKPPGVTPPSQEVTPPGVIETADQLRQPTGTGITDQPAPPGGDVIQTALPDSMYAEAEAASVSANAQSIADMIGQSQGITTVGAPSGMFQGMTMNAGTLMPNLDNMDPAHADRLQRISEIFDQMRQRTGGLPTSGGVGQNAADALSPTTGVEGVTPGGSRSPQSGGMQPTPTQPAEDQGYSDDDFADLLDFEEDAESQSVTPAGTTGEGDQQKPPEGGGELEAEDVDTRPDGSDDRKPPEGETQPGDDTGTSTGGDDEQTGPQTIRYTTGGVTFERTEYPDGRPSEITVVSGSSYTDGVATIDLDRDLRTGDVTGGHINITNPDANLSRLDIDHDPDRGTSGGFDYDDGRIKMTGSYDLNDNTDVSIQAVNPDESLFDSMRVHLEPGGGDSGELHISDHNITGDLTYNEQNQLDINLQSARDDTLFDSMQVHLEPGGADTGELRISDHNITGDMTYNEQNQLDINLQTARDDTLFDSMRVHLEPGGADTGELHISDHNITGDLTYNEQNQLDINFQTARDNTLFDSMQVHLEPGGADTGELHLSDHNIEGSVTYDELNRFDMNLRTKNPDAFLQNLSGGAGGGQKPYVGADFQLDGGYQLGVDHIKGGGTTLELGHRDVPLNLQWNSETHEFSTSFDFEVRHNQKFTVGLGDLQDSDFRQPFDDALGRGRTQFDRGYASYQWSW